VKPNATDRASPDPDTIFLSFAEGGQEGATGVFGSRGDPGNGLLSCGTAAARINSAIIVRLFQDGPDIGKLHRMLMWRSRRGGTSIFARM